MLQKNTFPPPFSGSTSLQAPLLSPYNQCRLHLVPPLRQWAAQGRDCSQQQFLCCSFHLVSSTPVRILHRLRSLQVHLLWHGAPPAPLTLALPLLLSFFFNFCSLPCIFSPFLTNLVGSALACSGSCCWCSWKQPLTSSHKDSSCSPNTTRTFHIHTIHSHKRS